jgi:hypothetical protein
MLVKMTVITLKKFDRKMLNFMIKPLVKKFIMMLIDRKQLRKPKLIRIFHQIFLGAASNIGDWQELARYLP